MPGTLARSGGQKPSGSDLANTIDTVVSNGLDALDAAMTVYRGAYSAGTAYAVNDMVVATGGLVYVCIQAGTGHAPVSSPTYWTPLEAGRDYVDVQDYGATGDGITDDTVALNAAYAAHGALPIYFPPGTYLVSSTLNWQTHHLQLLGAGPGRSIIKMDASGGDVPILQMKGSYLKLEDIGLTYATIQTTNTNANCLELFGVFYSTFRRVQFRYGYRHIYLPQADGTGQNTNYVFSSVFENLDFNAWVLNAVNITSYNCYSTGNVWSNIYVQNQDPTNTYLNGSAAIFLSGHDESVFNQLNLEWQRSTRLLDLNNCGNMTIIALHVEGVRAKTSFDAFINVNGTTRLRIVGATFRANVVDNTASACSDYSLFRILSNSAEIDVQNLYEFSTTTVNSPSLHRLTGGASVTATKVRFTGYQSNAGFAAGDFFNGTLTRPVVRQTADAYTHLVTALAALATAATYGHLYLPTTVGGTPTGVPVSETGGTAAVVDPTANKLWFYSSSAWHNEVTDHVALANPHSVYALLAGASGGQSLTGGTASGDNLTLVSTSNATKGKILLGTASAYDQVNDRLGLGATSPTWKLEVVSTASTSAIFSTSVAAGTSGGFGFFLATSTMPTASGHRIALLAASGRSGSTISTGAYIGFFAAEAWTLSSVQGAYMSFFTTAVGTATLTEQIRIASDGSVQHPVGGVFGAAVGTGLASTNVALEVNSTTKAFLLPRMTTTQRDAMTAINGMCIYNTTTTTAQVRENGAWNDFKGTA